MDLSSTVEAFFQRRGGPGVPGRGSGARRHGRALRGPAAGRLRRPADREHAAGAAHARGGARRRRENAGVTCARSATRRCTSRGSGATAWPTARSTSTTTSRWAARAYGELARAAGRGWTRDPLRRRVRRAGRQLRPLRRRAGADQPPGRHPDQRSRHPAAVSPLAADEERQRRRAAGRARRRAAEGRRPVAMSARGGDRALVAGAPAARARGAVPGRDAPRDRRVRHRRGRSATALQPARAPREQLLLREDDGELGMALFVDAAALANLERHDPAARLDDRNFSDFCLAVEGVSHFVYVALARRAAAAGLAAGAGAAGRGRQVRLLLCCCAGAEGSRPAAPPPVRRRRLRGRSGRRRTRALPHREQRSQPLHRRRWSTGSSRASRRSRCSPSCGVSTGWTCPRSSAASRSSPDQRGRRRRTASASTSSDQRRGGARPSRPVRQKAAATAAVLRRRPGRCRRRC